MTDAARRTLFASFTAQLRHDLEAGRFQPGERLGENALADLYSVSRPTVRATLQELARLGLVTRSSGRGATVTAIDLDEVKMLLTLRSQLEPMLVRRFTELSTGAQMSTFADAASAFGRAIGGDDDLAAAQRHLDDFYRVLLDGAGSWALASAVDVQHAMLTMYRHRELAPEFQSERYRAAAETHGLIVPIMQRRDSRAAHALCARHMHEDATAVLRELFAQG
ncbi:MAG: GntR family transcriptional regulator [Pseudoclavibacter sp.]